MKSYRTTWSSVTFLESWHMICSQQDPQLGKETYIYIHACMHGCHQSRHININYKWGWPQNVTSAHWKVILSSIQEGSGTEVYIQSFHSQGFFSAFFQRSGLLVAIKTFNQMSHLRPMEVQTREFEILRQLNHTNIIQLLDIEVDVSIHQTILPSLPNLVWNINCTYI